MKYLKTFNSILLESKATYRTTYQVGFSYVELSQEIQNNLKDICLELTDDGNFVVDISNLNRGEDFGFTSFSLYKPRNNKRSPFSYQEVSEVMDRIKDYMNGLGYTCNFFKDKRDEYTMIELIIYFTKK